MDESVYVSEMQKQEHKNTHTRSASTRRKRRAIRASGSHRSCEIVIARIEGRWLDLDGDRARVGQSIDRSKGLKKQVVVACLNAMTRPPRHHHLSSSAFWPTAWSTSSRWSKPAGFCVGLE